MVTWPANKKIMVTRPANRNIIVTMTANRSIMANREILVAFQHVLAESLPNKRAGQ